MPARSIIDPARTDAIVRPRAVYSPGTNPSSGLRGKLVGMATIHVYHGQAEAIAAALRGGGHEVVAWTSAEAFVDALPSIEILVTQRGPALTAGRKLRLIHGLGAGVDDLLPFPPGVEVCTARGLMAAEASEHAVAMMLALERNLPTMFARQRAHAWKMFPVGRLAGRAVGIVGVGAIGSRVARICSAMEMRVLGVCKRPRPIGGVTMVSLAALLEEADYVVVCTPLTSETRGMIDARRMKRGAALIALGRGGVVDEEALLVALSEGHVGGAALDVFDDEPLRADSPWWSAPNTIVTPHVAGFGGQYIERIAALIRENVDRFERGEQLLCKADPTLGY